MITKARHAGVAIAALLLVTASVAQAGTLPSFTKLVQDNRGAVVSIRATREAGAQGAPGMRVPQGPGGAPLPEFFRRYFEQIPRAPQPDEGRSMGAGFIISPDGYILTNAHVVRGAERIVVGFGNHSEKIATLVGHDDRTDVALLKIDATGLPVVKTGDSDAVQVGQWVLAIGSPFGLEHTATQGIVSAVARSLPNEGYVPFIQTDVAVNPGNSGGPLFDTDGKVVGINSQIFSRTGGYMGLSFAIPINVAMRVADQIKTHGKVVYGWLGVTIQPVSQSLAESFGLDQPRGALVVQLANGGPAANAGVKVGDVILAFNGEMVRESADLPPLVGATAVGSQADVRVLRDGTERTVRVPIGQLGSESPVLARGEEAPLGFAVDELDAGERAKLGVGDRGVKITGVEGAAQDSGFRPGDVLLAVNHRDIRSTRELAQVVRGLPAGHPVPVLVQRGNTPRFLTLRVPETLG